MIMTLLRLFYEFFKVGLFSVGGGLATLPFLYNLSDTMHWFTHNDIANMIAIAESTPGAIGINMASYSGYLTGSIPGGIIATVGLITPSIIIIIIIANLLNKFKDNKYVERAFYGLRPASVALIAAAGVSVVKTALVNIDLWQETGSMLDLFSIPAIILAVIIFIGQKKTNWHPIVFIVISAIVGIVLKF